MKSFDPTRTKTLRSSFERRLRRHVNTLATDMRQWFENPENWLLSDSNYEDDELDALTLELLTANAGRRSKWSFVPVKQVLAAFTKWLNKRISSTDPEQAQIYVDSDGFVGRAYEAGDEQAVEKQMPESAGSQLVKGVQDEIVKSIMDSATDRAASVITSFRPGTFLDRLKILRSQARNQITGLGQRVKSVAINHITEGMIAGSGPREIARAIYQSVRKISKKDATRIARTEIIRAHAEGTLDRFEAMGVKHVGVNVEWVATRLQDGSFEKRVCPRCRAMAGIVVPIERAHGMIPVHPNCILPGTLVSGNVLSAFKSWYDGEVVEIFTSGGSNLSMTVEHPIPTSKGRVVADSLNVGDQVICDRSTIEPGILPGNEQNRPVPIEQVFETLSAMRGQVPATRFDFDSNQTAYRGEVDIVGTSADLLSNDSPFPEESLNGSFMNSNHCLMSCVDLLPASAGTHTTDLHSFRLTLRALFDSMFLDDPGNSTSVDFEFLAQNISRLTVGVPFNDFQDGEFLPEGHSLLIGLGSQLNTFASKPLLDGLALNPDFYSQLITTHSGLVFADEVTHIRRFHYSGPVYDLETVPGHFIAGGVVSYNCRCAWAPSLETTQRDKVRKAVKRAVLSQRSKKSKSNKASDSGWPGPAIQDYVGSEG